MPRGTEQLLVAAAVGAGRRLVTAEPSWVAERRGRCNLEQGLGHSAGSRRGRSRRGCPDAGHALRCPVRVLGPPNGRPSTGRAGVRCRCDRCPRDQCNPGVRTDTRPVSASGASALSARRWILGCVAAAGQPILGRIGWVCRGGPRAAWSSLPESSLPESGLAGEEMVVRWPCVARMGRWHTWPPLRLRTGCGAWPTLGAGSSARVPVGWLGSTRRSRCSQSPAGASWAGGRRDARRGAIPGGGDHAAWSLRWCWSRVVQLRRAHLVGGGAGCGRAAAAVREARCR
jgi:hypothetical protein